MTKHNFYVVASRVLGGEAISCKVGDCFGKIALAKTCVVDAAFD